MLVSLSSIYNIRVGFLAYKNDFGVSMKKNYSLFVAVVLVCLLVSCGGDVPTNANKGPFSRGGQYYDTLQEAIDSLKGRSVSEDHIIRLNQNASGKGAVITGIVSEIKIDFGSYTYTLADSSQGIVVEGGNGVEISGGTIELGSGNTFTSVITTKGPTSISGTTIDVSDSDNDTAAVTTTSGTLNILGSTKITAKKDSNALSVSGNGVVKVVSTDVSISGGLSVRGTAEVNLDKGNFKIGTLVSDSTSKLYKTNEAAIGAFDGNLDEFNNKAVTHESFNVWVPSSAVLSVSVSSSRGLTNMIEANDVFDTGNPSFDLQYAQAVMQCMPFFSKLEQVDGVSSTTNKDELRRLLQYSLYGFSVVPDMDRTKVNDDGVYVYYVAYEGKDVSKPVGVVEYYYNSKESKLTYRQFVMLTILTGNEDHGMENAVLVYCLDDVSVGKDGTLAVNQLKTDGTFETKEAYTDYLWIRNENTSYDVTGNPHFDFERRVMTFRSERGITASFSQPWASFSYEGDSWDKVSDNDTLKVLMKSKSADYQITEDNKDNFDGETAVSFARLVYANGNSIAKENGWTSYGDFAAASLREINTTEHEWLFGTERKTDGTMKNTEFWMSYFDFDNAAEGNKTKRAYSNSQLVYGCNGDDEAHYVMGSSAYVGNGFSNLFGAYSGESSNRSITEFIITKFLPYCTVASESQIKTFVTNNIVSFKEAEQNDQPYDPDHIHTFSDEWTTDEDFHWHAATCSHTEETRDKSRHNYNPDTWVITKEATIDEPGVRCNVCENCGYKVTEIIPAFERWFYHEEDGSIEPTYAYKSSISGVVVIPDKVNGKPVTIIRRDAFSNNENVTSVVIPDSVTIIEDDAFSGCTRLTSVTIGKNVKTIGHKAFHECRNLESIIIPDSVTEIGIDAFRGCTGVTSVIIGKNVTSIGMTAFFGCNPEHFENKSGTSLDYYFNNTIYEELGNPADLKISEMYTKIVLSGTTGLKSVTIPDSVTSIYNAFSDCTSLTSVTFGRNVTSIGETAFSNCSALKNITIPDSVTLIENSAFYGCTSLTSITIPDSVTGIGSRAFEGCTGLTSVSIGKSVTGIGANAFERCTNLTSVTNGDSVASIGGSAFEGCINLTSVNVGKAVTSIGNRAFYGCKKLAGIVLPDSVTSIGDWAFYGCEGLASVTIGKNVTRIGDRAFYGCNPEEFVNNSAVDLEYHFSSDEYEKFGNPEDLKISELYTAIDSYCFRNSATLKSITIPNSVVSIGDYAFDSCSGLTSITIPDSVTEIKYRAFEGCTGLTSVTIGANVTSIEDRAFYGCNPAVFVNNSAVTLDYMFDIYEDLGKPAELTISELYTSIGYDCFKNTELQSITIPGTVKSIGDRAFAGCTELTSITIPASVTSIGGGAFEDCTGLTSIAIPDSVTSIDGSLFRGCTGLTSITIPDSVTSIGGYAFGDCNQGLVITFLGTETQWNNVKKHDYWTLGENSIQAVYEIVFSPNQ